MKSRPKLVGDPDHLIPSWSPQDAQASAHPGQTNCDVCGLVGAGSHGFGCFAGVRGTWACDDAECRAEAEARAADGRQSLIAAE